jgi:hypothetical protein
MASLLVDLARPMPSVQRRAGGETMHRVRILGYFLRGRKNNCSRQEQLQSRPGSAEVHAQILFLRRGANT